MSEALNFNHFDNGDENISTFTASDLDFLRTHGIQTASQIDENDRMKHEFDLALYRSTYVDVINNREGAITAYINDRTNDQLADDVVGVEELAHEYFRSYIDTLLRAPATASIDTAQEITDALGLADASQSEINRQTIGAYRFNIDVLKDYIASIVATTSEPKQIKMIVESLYQKNVYDVVLGFVHSDRS